MHIAKPNSIAYEQGKTCQVGSIIAQNLGYFAPNFFVHLVFSFIPFPQMHTRTLLQD